MGYLVVDTFGFADSIEYDFGEALNVNKQLVYPNNDIGGKYTDEKEFLIPMTIIRNTDIPINITVKKKWNSKGYSISGFSPDWFFYYKE